MDLAKTLTGLQHIGVPTLDLDGSIKFYETLGFQKIYETVNEANHNYRVAFVECGGTVMELYEESDTAKTAGAINHIALNSTDIEKSHKACEELGYTFYEEEITALPFWANGIRYFSIFGPSHEIIEFCQKL